MNYTTNRLNGVTPISRRAMALPSAFSGFGIDAVGTLTNYKKVVDIDESAKFQKVHYDLSKYDLDVVEKKLKAQKSFLDNSSIYDRINQKHIPLSDIIVSAYHAPERYYAELQNRINTLTQIAEQRKLKPLFMTLTLPSEYHKYKTNKQGELVPNKKYNYLIPKESVKVLTKMFARLRQDRSLKELSKDDRLYFRVNEPHKDGTPHTHILMFVPSDRVQRVKETFKRLFDEKANDIQDEIHNSTSYIMKYINKTIPLSKGKKLTEKDRYMNAWYSKNRVIRFNSSKTLAPLNIYRLLHNRYSMLALTKLINENHFTIFVAIDSNKIFQIIDDFGDIVYTRSDNYNVCLMGRNLQNYSQQNSSFVQVA